MFDDFAEQHDIESAVFIREFVFLRVELLVRESQRLFGLMNKNLLASGGAGMSEEVGEVEIHVSKLREQHSREIWICSELKYFHASSLRDKTQCKDETFKIGARVGLHLFPRTVFNLDGGYQLAQLMFRPTSGQW